MNLLSSSRKKSFAHLLKPFNSSLKKSSFTQRLASSSSSSSRIFYDNSKLSSELQSLLTEDPKFLEVLEEAQQRFYPKYMEIRKQRPLTHQALRNQIENGFLDYRSDTKWIRESSWQAATIPDVLSKRPVSIVLLTLLFCLPEVCLICCVSSLLVFRLNSLDQPMISR
jgi:hypothetical protein